MTPFSHVGLAHPVVHTEPAVVSLCAKTLHNRAVMPQRPGFPLASRAPLVRQLAEQLHGLSERAAALAAANPAWIAPSQSAVATRVEEVAMALRRNADIVLRLTYDEPAHDG
jgi:hypothetical protein